MLYNNNSYFKICGGKALQGEVQVSGSKNAILPLLFASLLCDGTHKFQNVPNLKDVKMALQILKSLGVTYYQEQDQLKLQISNLNKHLPCPISAQSFRASILCLGPLLARCAKVQIPLPGGCNIGSRPIDIHLKAFKKMGVDIYIKDNIVHAHCLKKTLQSANINFDFPSVGATENIIMACVLTKNTSIINNIACEPEITDLILYLQSLGAQIEYLSPKKLRITGVSQLRANPKPYHVIPDRIEAGTWLLAGACTQGNIKIKKCNPKHLSSLLTKLQAAGCDIHSNETEIHLKKSESYQAICIKTDVYPGFPTDLQAQFMVFMTQLQGLSSIEETIFENRFCYIQQLNLMKTGIFFKNQNKACITGPVQLKAHKIKAMDLRAGASMILAALIAQGTSQVYGLQHIQRGYENLFSKLQNLGASIELCEDS